MRVLRRVALPLLALLIGVGAGAGLGSLRSRPASAAPVPTSCGRALALARQSFAIAQQAVALGRISMAQLAQGQQAQPAPVFAQAAARLQTLQPEYAKADRACTSHMATRTPGP